MLKNMFISISLKFRSNFVMIKRIKQLLQSDKRILKHNKKTLDQDNLKHILMIEMYISS